MAEGAVPIPDSTPEGGASGTPIEGQASSATQEVPEVVSEPEASGEEAETIEPEAESSDSPGEESQGLAPSDEASPEESEE